MFGVSVWGRAEGCLGSMSGARARVLTLGGRADPAPSHGGRDDARPRHLPRAGDTSCPGRGRWRKRGHPTISQSFLLHCPGWWHRCPSITLPVPNIRGAGPHCPLGPLCPPALPWGCRFGDSPCPRSAGRPVSTRGAGGCATLAMPGTCVARLAWPRAVGVFSWRPFHFPKAPSGPVPTLGWRSRDSPSRKLPSTPKLGPTCSPSPARVPGQLCLSPVQG